MPPAGKLHIRMKSKKREGTIDRSRSRATTETSLDRSSSGTSLSTMPLSTSPSAPSPLKVMVASRSDITKMTEEAVRDALKSRYDEMSDRLDARLDRISQEMTTARTERERVEQENEQLKGQLSEAVAWIVESDERKEEQYKSPSRNRSKRRHKSGNNTDEEQERAHTKQPEVRRRHSPKPKKERTKTGRSSPQRQSRSSERPGTSEARGRRWRPKSSAASADDRRHRSSSPEERRTSGSGQGVEVRLTRRKRLAPNGIYNDHSSSDSSDSEQLYREKKYVDNHKWPEDSPPAGVYDVRNTSAKMVIYNNKRPSTSNRLRGYSNQTLPREPSPKRHLPNITNKKNPDRHVQCTSSGSQRPDPDPNMPGYWLNEAVRPQSQGEGDPNGRHAGCYLDAEMIKFLHLHGPVRAKQVLARVIPDDVSNNEYRFLRHPELTPGERRYLSTVASVYSVNQMKQMKQAQYRSLLKKQLRLGFASASEYEKYMRYLEGPRIVHPGTKGEGSKDEGQKGSSKKSEALLARRRAAQEGKTSKQDQKSQASPYDEDLTGPVKDEKDFPGSSRRRGSRRRRQEAEVADDGRRPTSAREVWGDDDDGDDATSGTRRRAQSARKSEFSFLQAVADEADREDERRLSARHIGRMSVDSISSAGSSHDVQPHPPHTPREGYGRPKSRLGRTKPKQEDIEDEDNIPEDQDTNQDNSLLVVVETNGQPTITPVPIKRRLSLKSQAESRGTQTGDEAEPEPELESAPQDVGTSISDFEAYLKAVAAAEEREREKKNTETVEMGTSMAEERAARREKRRKRREERQRQAEEHRRMNLSVEDTVAAAAASAADIDGARSEVTALEDDGTSSVYSRDTGVSQATETPEPKVCNDLQEKNPTDGTASESQEVQKVEQEEKKKHQETQETDKEDSDLDIPLLQSVTNEIEAEEEGHPEEKNKDLEVNTLDVESKHDVSKESQTIPEDQKTPEASETIREKANQTEETSVQTEEPSATPASFEPQPNNDESPESQPNADESRESDKSPAMTPTISPEPRQETSEQDMTQAFASPVGSDYNLRGVGSTEDMLDVGDDVSMDIRFQENPPDPVSTSVGGVDSLIFSPITPTPRIIEADEETVLSDTDNQEVLTKSSAVIKTEEAEQPVSGNVKDERAVAEDVREVVEKSVAVEDNNDKQEDGITQNAGEDKVEVSKEGVDIVLESSKSEEGFSKKDADIVDEVSEGKQQINGETRISDSPQDDPFAESPKESTQNIGNVPTAEDVQEQVATVGEQTDQSGDGSPRNDNAETTADTSESHKEETNVSEKQNQIPEPDSNPTLSEGTSEQDEGGDKDREDNQQEQLEPSGNTIQSEEENNLGGAKENTEGTIDVKAEVSNNDTDKTSDEGLSAENEARTQKDEAERQAAKKLVEECLKNAVNEVSWDISKVSDPVANTDEQGTQENEGAKTEKVIADGENKQVGDTMDIQESKDNQESIVKYDGLTKERVKTPCQVVEKDNGKTDASESETSSDKSENAKTETDSLKDNETDRGVDPNIEITKSTSVDSLEPTVSELKEAAAELNKDILLDRVLKDDSKSVEDEVEQKAGNSSNIDTETADAKVQQKGDEGQAVGQDISAAVPAHESESNVEPNTNEQEEDEQREGTKQLEIETGYHISEVGAAQNKTLTSENEGQPTGSDVDQTNNAKEEEQQEKASPNEPTQEDSKGIDQTINQVKEDGITNTEDASSKQSQVIDQERDVMPGEGSGREQAENEGDKTKDGEQPISPDGGTLKEEDKGTADENNVISENGINAVPTDDPHTSLETVEVKPEDCDVSAQETEDNANTDTKEEDISIHVPTGDEISDKSSSKTNENDEEPKSESEQQVEQTSETNVATAVTKEDSIENKDTKDDQIETSKTENDAQEAATQNGQGGEENIAISREVPTELLHQDGNAEHKAQVDSEIQPQETESIKTNTEAESAITTSAETEVQEDAIQTESLEDKETSEEQPQKDSLSLPGSPTPSLEEDEPRNKESSQVPLSGGEDNNDNMLDKPGALRERRPSITVNSPEGHIVEQLIQPENNENIPAIDKTIEQTQNTEDNNTSEIIKASKTTGQDGMEKESSESHLLEQTRNGQENGIESNSQSTPSLDESPKRDDGNEEQLTNGSEEMQDKGPDSPKTHVPVIKKPMFLDQPNGSDLKLKLKGKLDNGKPVTYTLTGSGVSKALSSE